MVRTEIRRPSCLFKRGFENKDKSSIVLKSGYFISFEGGEGSGKSTQINHLAKHLRKKGFDVLVTREPGGTLGAESIRYVLLNTYIQIQSYEPTMEAILFSAARADHVDKLIIPALKAGNIVLCDRFIDSTRVYQGILHKLPRGYISLLEKITVDQTIPDLTFILDLRAKRALARVHARQKKSWHKPDRFEKASLNVQENRRQAFLKIAKMEPNRCFVIDATRSINMIADEIADISDRKISERNMQ
ncbi:MAG: dTMP kinase [Candidatus Tokpelaia sp. JSC189]|nr:MAG: dTMP kinase [Candidatus Tokpelaia sp. JSC189]